MSKKKIITRVVVALAILMVSFILVLAFVINTTDVDVLIATGNIDLNFNDGIVVFNEEDLNLAPGETVRQEMFIENIGEEAFYYRIYLENITGNLVDSTMINIYDEEGELLISIDTAEFDSSNYFTTGEIVEAGERVNLIMEIVVMESSGNEYQKDNLSFDIIASAIQSKNNINFY